MHPRIILALFAITVSTATLQAQKKIKLTNNNTGKERFLTEGQRVVYLLQGKTYGEFGILNKVEDSVLTIDNKAIAISQLNGIGRRKKGGALGGAVLLTLGTGMFINAIMPDEDPCPDCIDAGTENEGLAVVGKVLEITAATGVIYLGAKALDRNSVRDIRNRWTLEVVD